MAVLRYTDYGFPYQCYGSCLLTLLLQVGNSYIYVKIITDYVTTLQI